MAMCGALSVSAEWCFANTCRARPEEHRRRETSETREIDYAPGRLKYEAELLPDEVGFQKQQRRQSNEHL